MTIADSHIFIDGIRLYAFHGAHERESRVGAWFSVSVRVQYNICRAMETDNLCDTLSYADVLQTVKREMALPSRLLEHVAGRIARALCTSFDGAGRIWVRVVKENPPMQANCQGAGVELEVVSGGSENQ